MPWVLLVLVVAATPFLPGVVSNLQKRFGPPLAVEPLYPLDGATDVSPQARVAAALSRPIDPARADTLGVHVRDADGREVEGGVTFGDDMGAVVFQALSSYPPGEYDVVIGLRDNGTVEAEEPLASWSFTVPEQRDLTAGPGGPTLLVSSPADPWDDAYAEILRTEGLNSFTTTSAADLTPTLLRRHRVVLLADTALAGDVDAAALAEWVDAGGDLIVFEPTAALADLAGVGSVTDDLDGGYVRIDTAGAPGAGLTRSAMQFHGGAQIVDVRADTRTVATLHQRPGGPAVGPAVTIREVGEAGGTVAAFTYDLAESVVLTRQGNPEWAGQERDGIAPLRSNDLFTGTAAEEDHLDRDRIEIPQADEQMRLLANLILHASYDGGPMPRSWYFPHGAKAVLVMAADDHGTESGTEASFDRMLALSPRGCDVDRWECARATAWIYPSTGLSAEQAEEYVDQGFDIGAHVSTFCNNWTEASLALAFRRDLLAFWERFDALAPQTGSRLHCIAWSDYTTQAEVARFWGVRFDMNYYYWPASWADGRVGFMTGSGMPMRFVDPGTGLIDVFQQETHLVNETFAASSGPVALAIDRALGPEGYYGAFGTHYDFSDDFDVELMEVAASRGVPMVSADQMLRWVDARDASTYGDQVWDGRELSFTLSADPHAEPMLRTLLPVRSVGGDLDRLEGPQGPVDVEVETIKGVEYASFTGVSGAYVASYGG